MNREPAALTQAGQSGERLDTATVQRLVDEVVGPDPAKGPPVSRAYEHRSCQATTVASGDDLGVPNSSDSFR